MTGARLKTYAPKKLILSPGVPAATAGWPYHVAGTPAGKPIAGCSLAPREGGRVVVFDASRSQPFQPTDLIYRQGRYKMTFDVAKTGNTARTCGSG